MFCQLFLADRMSISRAAQLDDDDTWHDDTKDLARQLAQTRLGAKLDDDDMTVTGRRR